MLGDTLLGVMNDTAVLVEQRQALLMAPTVPAIIICNRHESLTAGACMSSLNAPGKQCSATRTILAVNTCLKSPAGRTPQVSLPGLATPPGGNPATSARAPRHHQPAVAYVAQSTPLHGHLTVRETLRYTALLVLGPDLGRAAAEQRAEALLHELGLTAAADTFVGTWYLRGISGGWSGRSEGLACLFKHTLVVCV